MQIATKQNFKLKQIILLFFILFVNCTFSLTLSNINELRELSNFDEIKNIEVEKVIEMKEAVKELERIGNTVYYKKTKIPYEGVIITKENKKIKGIYFYKNGKTEGDGFDYFENGKINCRSKAKNDIDTFNECYDKNGGKIQTFKGNGGITGILTVYYDGGNKKAYVSEVNQRFDSQNKKQVYTKNGKTRVYERNGNILGELNFNNDSLLGERQKLYMNGKVKYDFIGGTKDIKGLKPMKSYIEYFDNSDAIKYDCEETSKDNWTCKEHNKNGSFKRNIENGKAYVAVNNNHHGNFWINMFLGAWNILTQTH